MKAAGGPLSEHYYLYVARNIRLGNSGDAELLEIPQTVRPVTNRQRETRERNVQVDLRSFDFDDDPIIERPIEGGIIDYACCESSSGIASHATGKSAVSPESNAIR